MECVIGGTAKDSSSLEKNKIMTGSSKHYSSVGKNLTEAEAQSSDKELFMQV